MIFSVLFLVFSLTMCSGWKEGLEKLDSLEINEPDLEGISDGSYRGSCEGGPVLVEVEVEVKDNAMKTIVLLKHRNGKGKDAEAIIDDILQAQSLDVDVISGATYSSKAILKAIDNALNE